MQNVKDATEDLHYTQSGILSQEEVVRLNPDAFVIPVWNYDGKHGPGADESRNFI